MQLILKTKLELKPNRQWKLFLTICLLINALSAFASQVHPSTAVKLDRDLPHTQSGFQTITPRYCQIAIFNASDKDLSVFGILDDGARLEAIDVYSGKLRYMSLYYHGRCHKYMQLYVSVLHGGPLYNEQAFAGDDIVVKNPT